MGLPPGTVRSHLHHARRTLRSLLPELEKGEE
jgi:DNA-directed RNA polymerase specialized sigma24 family protein